MSRRSKASIQAETELRRLEIMQLVRRKYNYRQICAKLGVSYATVKTTVQLAKRRAIAGQIELSRDEIDDKLEQLNEVITKCYEAYDASGRDEHRTKWGNDEEGQLVILEDTVTTRAPNAAQLNPAVKAIELQCKLLGYIGKDEFQAPTVETPKILRVIVKSREELDRYNSIKLEQVRVIEGTATPSP